MALDTAFNSSPGTLDTARCLLQHIFPSPCQGWLIFISYFFQRCCQNRFKVTAEDSRRLPEFPVLPSLTPHRVPQHQHPLTLVPLSHGHVLMCCHEPRSDQGLVLEGNILGVIINVQRHSSTPEVTHVLFHCPNILCVSPTFPPHPLIPLIPRYHKNLYWFPTTSA